MSVSCYDIQKQAIKQASKYKKRKYQFPVSLYGRKVELFDKDRDPSDRFSAKM